MEYERYIDLQNIIINGDLADRIIIAKEIKLFINDLIRTLDEYHKKVTQQKSCSVCDEKGFCDTYKRIDEYDMDILYCDDFKFKENNEANL
jgi:hypothetical protein